jgi:hypothetical protein
MMRVLDRRNTQSAPRGESHQPRDQVRLAGVLPAHDSEDFHAASPLNDKRMVPIRALTRRTRHLPLEKSLRLPLVSAA